MTMPMEFEEPEEILVAGRYVETKCVRCRVAPAVAIPSKVDIARCIECGRLDAGVIHDSYVPTGSWHPTVRYGTFGVTLPDPERETFPEPKYVGPVLDMKPGHPPLLQGKVAPAAFTSLADEGLALGWPVRFQHSRGHYSHSTTGKATALRDVLSLRFGAHVCSQGRQAYALYSRAVSGDTWTWDRVQIWGPKLAPYSGCGVTELREYLSTYALAEDDGALSRWLTAVRDRRRAQELAAKIVACPGEPCRLPKDEHTHRANGDIKRKTSRKEVVQGA